VEVVAAATDMVVAVVEDVAGFTSGLAGRLLLWTTAASRSSSSSLSEIVMTSVGPADSSGCWVEPAFSQLVGRMLL
jgi:hypothetical protein